MNSETRSRMSSFSASSVVSAGDVDANRARWIVDARSDTSERPIRSTSSVRPGRDGTTRTAATPTANVAFSGATSKRPSLTRSDAPRPFGSSDSRETAVHRPGTDEGPEPLPRERRVRVAEPDASRRRREAAPHGSPPRSPPPTTRRARTVTIRSWTLDGSVLQRSAQRLPVDAGPGTRLDDTDRLRPRHRPGRRATARRTGRRAGLRASPRRPGRGDRRAPRACLRGAPTRASTRVERSPVVRLGDGVGEERPGAELATARRGERAARPDEADRGHPGARRPRGPRRPAPRSPSTRPRPRPRSSFRAAACRARGARSPRTRPRGRPRGTATSGEDDQRPPRATAGPPDGREERA